MKLKVMILNNDWVIGRGIVLCTEDGLVLPGQVKVDSTGPDSIEGHTTIAVQFIVDGERVAWSNDVPVPLLRDEQAPGGGSKV
ncbi:hypothetical protein [Sphingomonas sanxanigenens]|uniref:Uncharacterized protein n=1 Tax=Sphingomonas sanxanigenens DSM 19645 = NX02 TaxID=1123269 RepID=W0AJQ2_9SPHN|nr:hypothetical protein [Sphingomonas sanxanigenens]AHE55900.1 hypothetical protein NX02_21325 [Sphingomonas sanxanigenens DSM 19645 = NX02]